MAINDIVQTIAEARVDARSLSEFVFKPAGFKVARRLALPVDTLDFYLNRFDSINSTYTQSVNTINNAISQAQQSVIAADALIATNANNASNAVASAISGVAIDANLVTDALVPIMPIASGASSRTQLDKNRENISILDFFTAEEMAGYTTDPRFDAARPVQAFFDYITNNDVRSANADGVFRSTVPIVVGGANAMQTKQITGNFTLYSVAPMDELLTVYSGGELNWLGTVKLYGHIISGNTGYAARGTKVGLFLGGKYISSRNIFSSINVSNFSECGVLADQLTTLTNLGDVRTTNCGSGCMLAGYSLTSTYTTVSSTGDGVNQRSVLSVATLPLDVTRYPSFVYVDGDYHYIHGKDDVAGTVSVYPLLDESATSGELTYVYGGGVVIRGGDASVIKASKIDAKRCGMGLVDGALYGAVVDNLVNQSCGVGYAVGLYPSAAHLGGQINGLYCENNDCDILKVAASVANTAVYSEYALNYKKVRYIAPYSQASKRRILYAHLGGFAINNGGYLNVYEEEPFNAGSSKYNVFLTRGYRGTNSMFADTKRLILHKPSDEINQAFGMQYKEIVIFGTGANNAPSGIITLEAAGGATVEGQASINLQGFEGAAVIRLAYGYSTGNYRVLANTKSNNGAPLTARNNSYFPMIPANSVGSLVFTVTGAKIGDYVEVATEYNLGSNPIWARVSTANTVTVYIENKTAADITPPRAFYSVKVTPVVTA